MRDTERGGCRGEREGVGQEFCKKVKNCLGYILRFQGSLGYRMRLSEKKNKSCILQFSMAWFGLLSSE